MMLIVEVEDMGKLLLIGWMLVRVWIEEVNNYVFVFDKKSYECIISEDILKMMLLFWV